MADLQEQLQAILGDPQAMGQITAIARALTGGSPQADPPHREPEAQDVEFVPVEEGSQGRGEGNMDGGPEAAYSTEPGMTHPTEPETHEGEGSAPDLSALLGMLGGGADIDPRLIQIALTVFSEYSAQDNEKAALLAALKPFLRGERLEKMEKAEKIARLSRVVRTAIRLFREEGTEHV